MHGGSAPLQVITPPRGWGDVGLGDVWRHRELLAHLAWRDFKVRYKQTLLGASWALIQPLAVMVAFTLVFGGLAKIASGGIPYPVFFLAALVPWTYFSNSVTAVSNSLVSSQHLLTKVYFPRLVLPLAALGTALVDVVISLVALIALAVILSSFSVATLALIVPLLGLALLAALAVGLWAAALNARYRDVRFVVPFALQLGLFVSPVAYPASLVPERWQFLYWLNPMTTVIEGFRFAVTGVGGVPLVSAAISLAACLILLFAGLLYFRRVESSFADIV